jgi:hypothetical protein
VASLILSAESFTGPAWLFPSVFPAAAMMAWMIRLCAPQRKGKTSDQIFTEYHMRYGIVSNIIEKTGTENNRDLRLFVLPAIFCCIMIFFRVAGTRGTRDQNIQTFFKRRFSHD